MFSCAVSFPILNAALSLLLKEQVDAEPGVSVLLKFVMLSYLNITQCNECVRGYSQGQKKEGYRGRSSSPGRTPRAYGTVNQRSAQTTTTKREKRFLMQPDLDSSDSDRMLEAVFLTTLRKHLRTGQHETEGLGGVEQQIKRV